MKFEELVKVAAGRPLVVECKEDSHDWESSVEPGMRMTIIGSSLTAGPDPTMKIRCDVSQFEDANKAFESRNYYDNQGNPTLTAREAGFFELQPVIYVDPKGDIANYLEIVDESLLALFGEYQAQQQPNQTYTGWLEQELQATRTKLPK